MDIRIANHGSIVILHAISEAAREWLDTNLADDVQTWGPTGTAQFHCSWLEPIPLPSAPTPCNRCGKHIDYDDARRDPKNGEPWCGCP